MTTSKKKTSKKRKNGRDNTIKRRDQKKFSALDPNYNLKIRTEEITDILDYADKLNDEDKAWLNSFVEEYVNANFQHKGKKIMKTTEEKRERYVANNRRNRDVYSRAIAANQLSFLNDVKQEINLEEMSDVEEIEDLANIKKS